MKQRPYKVFAERHLPVHTHAFITINFDPLCGRMAEDGFGETELASEPSCSICREIIARLNGTLSSAWSSRRPTESGPYWWRGETVPINTIVHIMYRGQDPFGQPELRAKRWDDFGWSPLDEWPPGEWQPVKDPDP